MSGTYAYMLTFEYMSYTILKADKYARLYLRFTIHVIFIFSYSGNEDNLLKHDVKEKARQDRKECVYYSVQ